MSTEPFRIDNRLASSWHWIHQLFDSFWWNILPFYLETLIQIVQSWAIFVSYSSDPKSWNLDSSLYSTQNHSVIVQFKWACANSRRAIWFFVETSDILHSTGASWLCSHEDPPHGSHLTHLWCLRSFCEKLQLRGDGWACCPIDVFVGRPLLGARDTVPRASYHLTMLSTVFWGRGKSHAMWLTHCTPLKALIRAAFTGEGM